MIQNKDSRIKIIKNAAYGYRNQDQFQAENPGN